jgi:hypothetical protein
MTYQIVEFTSSDFSNIEEEWQTCLKSSNANPLFSSWVWQYNWWTIWQPRLNLSLLLIGIYRKNILIGIAPCYTYKVVNRLGRTINRCEFIGAHSASDDSIRSEYLNFICKKSMCNQLFNQIFDYLEKQNIDEIVLLDTDNQLPLNKYLHGRYPLLYAKPDQGIKITTDTSFSTYLKGLGKNTRLKLNNRRKLLPNLEFKKLNKVDDIPHFFNQLNEMHLNRWNNPCFSSHSLDFHCKMAEFFLNQNQLYAWYLYDDDQPIGVCYDILIEKVRYNIQLGFFEHKNQKLSVGTLTLGFAIEDAHHDLDTIEYDLLAGNGKNSFYKKHLNGKEQLFNSIMIPLNFELKVSYFFRKLKRILNNLIN